MSRRGGSLFFGGSPGFVVKIQTEMRFAPGTGDLDWHFRARPVLMEEGVDGFKQNGFPARRHLRELRVHFQFSMKIKGAAVKAILPGHVGKRARDFEVEG